MSTDELPYSHVNKVQGKHTASKLPLPHKWYNILHALVRKENKHNGEEPDS